MTDDPIRLLDEGGSELLRTLISAAREEEPERAALQRTLIAVGVAAALTTATASASGAVGSAGVGGASGAAGTVALGSAKSVASSTLLVVVKWLAIGALTGTIASSAVYGVTGALTPQPSVISSAPLLQDTVKAPPSLPRAVTAPNLPEIPPPPAIVTPPPQVAAGPAASQPAPDVGAPLAAEVAALDGARQALGSSDAERTLQLLNGYEARFPEARMLPEALYLRLEAYTLKVDKSNAEGVARRILRVYPSSPHAARARTVLGLDR